MFMVCNFSFYRYSNLFSLVVAVVVIVAAVVFVAFTHMKKVGHTHARTHSASDPVRKEKSGISSSS